MRKQTSLRIMVLILVIALVALSATPFAMARRSSRRSRPRPVRTSITLRVSKEIIPKGGLLEIHFWIDGHIQGGTGRVSLYISRIGRVNLNTDGNGFFNYHFYIKRSIRRRPYRIYLYASYRGSPTTYPSGARLMLWA